MEGTLDESTLRARLRRCRDALAERNVDGLVCFPSTNAYYLTGFREEPGERHLLVFVTPDETAAVVPKLYLEQFLAESVFEREDVTAWDDGDDPTAVVGAVAADLGIDDGRVLVDDRMWARFTLDLRAACPDATFGLASEVLSDLRVRKDDAELAALREAARLSDEVSEAIRARGADVVGLTERELVAEIRAEFDARGGDGFSFEPVVGSGPNGARPHHRHGNRTIEAGDPVVLDFGTVVRGYPGDQTRTVVFDGDPPEGFEEVHGVVRDALERGVEAVEPGIEAQAVDRAAREVVEEAGYGDAFVHRTGHGLGLDVHEEPYIVEGNETVLEPGMVFSVEPGIYLEGEFGVRIEDIVAVTEDGCERLNGSPRTWKPPAGSESE